MAPNGAALPRFCEVVIMELTFGAAAFVFAVQVLSYTIKWMIGFGNPLISGPLLSMRLDNALITPGGLPVDLCVNACITWQNRQRIAPRRILPLLLCMMAGVAPGTWLLRFSMPWVLKALLGLVVVFLGLEMATRDRRPVRQGREWPWVKFVVAFFSGLCAALFGINMFLVAYLQRTARDYDEFKGSVCFLFLGENIFRTAVYAIAGLLTPASLVFAGVSLVGCLCARLVAKLLARRISEERLYRLAIVFFLLGGVSIIVKSVVFRA